MEIDRRHFIASLGGTAAVALMSHEAKAEALEEYMVEQLNTAAPPSQAPAATFPTAAEVDARIDTRHYRRGVGGLFLTTQPNAKVSRLEPMPAKPTFLDFFKLRFAPTQNHVLQSANRAMKTGMSEEIVLACLLHDTVHALMKTDHGYWGAQLYAPYVPEKTSFAIKYHQALRFFEDQAAGYVYPDLYRNMFGARLCAAAAHSGGLQDGEKSSVVHGTAHGHRERSICVRAGSDRLDRSICRYRGTPLQESERGSGQRQQPGRPHVADDFESGRASVEQALGFGLWAWRGPHSRERTTFSPTKKARPLARAGLRFSRCGPGPEARSPESRV